MSLSTEGWTVIVAALGAANLPFLNQRLLAVIPLPGKAQRPKPLGWRLLELLLLYFLLLGVSRLLEGRVGNVFPQGWEFYAVTLCLFLVFAFPGFVARYLVRTRD